MSLVANFTWCVTELQQRRQQTLQVRRQGDCQAIPALQKAPMSQVSEWGSAMSLVRDFNNGESYAVVGLAIGGDQDVTVGNVRNGRYTDAEIGNALAVGGGTIWFHVRANPLTSSCSTATARLALMASTYVGDGLESELQSNQGATVFLVKLAGKSFRVNV
ncbi:MAG: hypothetical protein ACXW39_03020 [Nitrospira sp.]